MHRKNGKIIIIIVLVFSWLAIVNGQNKKPIEIINVGDNWKEKVDSAIDLVSDTDPEKYRLLVKYCKRVEFSYVDFSTTVTPNTIVISSKDMGMNSINNIACVLVHESYHLYYFNEKVQLSQNQEELNCYKYEYDFISKLPTVEDWLFKHTVEQIIRYENLSDKK